MSVLLARFLLVLAVPSSLAVEACVHPSGAHDAATVNVAEPPPSSAPSAHGDRVDSEPAPDEGSALPATWSAVYGHDVPVGRALDVAGHAASALDATLAAPSGKLNPAQLERVTSQLDRVTRAYATAFHAPDAATIDQVQALVVAAATILRGSRYLDAHGYHDSAGDVRTDTKVSLSFEDIERGPGRRWRDEGLALARHCINLATTNELGLLREACLHLVQDYPAVTRRASVAGCACDPGDPLCSSSMSGWCRPDP